MEKLSSIMEHGEMKYNAPKPIIDEKVDTQLVYTNPWDAVVFHDKLIHGGALNKGNYTRVILEFTMFVNKNK